MVPVPSGTGSNSPSIKDRRKSLNDRHRTDARGSGARRQHPYADDPHAVQTTLDDTNTSMPYTFDPLFVEDPLADGNNVGRNAFRIFQIQRSFSDAHRALVAALEWDMQSAGEVHEENTLPLLKCLFQREDVVFDL